MYRTLKKPFLWFWDWNNMTLLKIQFALFRYVFAPKNTVVRKS